MQSRRHRVVFVTSQDESEIVLSQDQENHGLEIEEFIVERLKAQHSAFIAQHP